MQRVHRDKGTGWTPSLDAMLDFLIALLDRAEEIPPRVISIADHDDRPPAIDYVDASYSSAHSGLGIVLIDPLTGTKEYASALSLAWMLADTRIWPDGTR